MPRFPSDTVRRACSNFCRSSSASLAEPAGEKPGISQNGGTLSGDDDPVLRLSLGIPRSIEDKRGLQK